MRWLCLHRFREKQWEALPKRVCVSNGNLFQKLCGPSGVASGRSQAPRGGRRSLLNLLR